LQKGLFFISLDFAVFSLLFDRKNMVGCSLGWAASNGGFFEKSSKTKLIIVKNTQNRRRPIRKK